jgi:threonine aldolase
MRQPMRFFSDNAAAAHPRVMEAIVASNRVDTAYDGDEYSARLDGAFSDLFETKVRAFWVTTGTAANCLALAALCPPYRGILCHKDAHIEVDEAGAPGFFTGGAKLILVDGPGAKITPDTAAAACGAIRNDVHQVQPSAISITNATEYGLVYRAAQVAALGQLAKERGLAFHMDGARFANALATTGESPADVTWRAGVDAMSFGFVKNGGLNAEALVLFNTDLADEIAVRRKRAKAAPSRLVYPAEANELFLRVTSDEAASLLAQGFDFYDWGPGEIRLVTSWDQRAEDVERLAAALAAL